VKPGHKSRFKVEAPLEALRRFDVASRFRGFNSAFKHLKLKLRLASEAGPEPTPETTLKLLLSLSLIALTLC
jgi:hypothetical protein